MVYNDAGYQDSDKVPSVLLGLSGLKASRLIIDCSSSVLKDSKTAFRTLNRYYDRGVNTFEVDGGRNPDSEVMLGKYIKTYKLPRDKIVIMAKIGTLLNSDRTGAPRRHLNHKYIFDAVQASLKRLHLDYIDVLYCHNLDPETSVSQMMRALHGVVEAGYVRYLGMGPCMAYSFHIMQNYAITHNLTPFAVSQNTYSLVYREIEHEMLPTLTHFGVGSITCTPFMTRYLITPFVKMNGQYYDPKRADLNSTVMGIRVESIAKRRKVPMTTIALAWVLNRDFVHATVISPMDSDDLLNAANVMLTNEEMTFLEEKYQPVRPMPYAKFRDM